jgi:uncharacterized protein YbaR (Trm112 family)
MITDKILELLVCPETKQSLSLMDQSALSIWKKKASNGELKCVGGRTAEDDFEQILTREDGRIGYPIRDGIPILLIERGLKLDPQD